MVSASPFFATPLCSHSVSNNLVIFHHISSAKLSITDAILSCLQNPLKIVSKKVNVISTTQSGWNSLSVSVFGIQRNLSTPAFRCSSNVSWIAVVLCIIYIQRLLHRFKLWMHASVHGFTLRTVLVCAAATAAPPLQFGWHLSTAKVTIKVEMLSGCIIERLWVNTQENWCLTSYLGGSAERYLCYRCLECTVKARSPCGPCVWICYF